MSRKKVLIVGGGTAGLTIASQLHESFDVTILEKSSIECYPTIYRIPLLIGLLFRDSSQPFIRRRNLALECGRVIPFFESNVLGGASSINGCVHSLGSRVAWERILKRFDSSYHEVFAAFERLFSTNPSDSSRIRLRLAAQSQVDYAFSKTLTSLGVPAGSTNLSDAVSHGPIINTSGRLLRSSVLSLLRGKAVDIRLGVEVEGFTLGHCGRVTGVTSTKGAFKADYVVLSGGVIGTCSLLHRGVTKDPRLASSLNSAKIGSNVQDHTNLRINVLTDLKVDSLNTVANSAVRKLKLIASHLLGRSTCMSGTGATSAAQLDLDGDGCVDTRINMLQFSENGRHGSDGKYLDDEPGFSLSITHIHPNSTGSIELSSNGMRLNPNYLADPRDMELLKNALDFCLRILRSSPLDGLVKAIPKVREIESDPEAYIRNNLFSGHHLTGGAQYCVDKNFRVKGVEGLYICDASIISGYASSNIHSSVIIMSDIFCRRFLKQ